MASFDAITALIPTLHGRITPGACVEDVQSVVLGMGDADVVAVVEEVVAAGRLLEQIGLVGAGVIGVRSRRAAGHAGLAQSRGHRTAVSLVQHLTGVTKGEAARQVRVGEALVAPEDPGAGNGAGSGSAPGGPADGQGSQAGTGPDACAGNGSQNDTGDGAGAGSQPGSDSDPNRDGGFGPDGDTSPGSDGSNEDGSPAGSGPDATGGAGSWSSEVWHAVLGRALRDGRIVGAQFDAIRRGLGDPPDGATPAWAVAATQLVEEASHRTVEELLAAARMIRDLLDPDGAEARFLARYERRAFRTYLDQDGTRRASITFDDEAGAYVQALLDAALRPRRGGPRFVDPDEKARATELVADARSNDQLAYDLLLDIIRAGVLADTSTVFGTRQAGLRLIQTHDPDNSSRGPVAYTEDGLTVLPGAVADRRYCDTGSVTVTVDSGGNPLDVGREHRLFTPRQRIALAVRDGGCRWTGCDRPASYCEAHHIDEWHRDHGHTNINRGISLCRFHHMQLHHGRWRITRRGTDDFTLHDRQGNQTVLHRRLALTYAWAGINPPPQRFRPAA